MLHKIFLILLTLFSFNAVAGNNEFPATEFRIFAGGINASPDEVNQVVKAGGLEEYKTIGAFGIEGTFKLIPMFYLGLRGEGKYAKVRETATPSANPSNPYYSALQTHMGLLTLRVRPITTSFFFIDAFAGAGLQAGKLDVRTAGGEGWYSNETSASSVTMYGASMGLGFNNFYFFVEAGTEESKISNPTKTGVTSANLNEINTGGPFVFLGISTTAAFNKGGGKK